jgi:hypothetical protein
MASKEEYETLLATLENLKEVIISRIHTNDDGLAAHISNVFDLPFDKVIKTFETYRSNSGPMRLCPPNKTKITQKATQQIPLDLSKGDKATIVLNYGPKGKSHALFGDFKMKYVKYKDEFLNPTSWIRFTQLAIGPGWMLLGRDNLNELKKSLKKFNIPWQEIEYKEIGKNSKEKDSKEEPEPKKAKSKRKESSDSEEEPPVETKKSKAKPKRKFESSDSEEEPPVETKKSKSKSKAKPKRKESSDSEEEPFVETKKSKKVKPSSVDKLSTNQYGNLQEKKFGIIFAKLPTGKKGRMVNVAIGNQDTDTPPSKKYRGLKTVRCLTDLQIEECEDRTWTVLTEEMVDTLEGNEDYEDLGAELRVILASADPESDDSGSESDNSGSESDNSGSESDDSDSD